MQCEQGEDISQDFKEWKEILDLHSRMEDELFIPVLQARLKANNSDKQIPEDILTGNDHDDVKELVEDILGFEGDNTALVPKLKDLEAAQGTHLVNEETNIMPLIMLEAFTTRELWALDSFIVNHKLGYCDKEMIIAITKWWFGNVSVREGWPLMIFLPRPEEGSQRCPSRSGRSSRTRFRHCTSLQRRTWCPECVRGRWPPS
mmetsp:Transcript_5270/g.15328  ORF Transcript_5270/g.15328 Transcript_5270/m.15328 type:complete len:203 (-) Transcript_5270:632-1240(-)